MDTITGELEILQVTERAIQLRTPRQVVWLPRSQLGKIEYGQNSTTYTPKVGIITSLELPRWLVEKKGL